MPGKENLKLLAVAVLCLSVGLAGPSVAGAVQQGLNADQVDGKHAVGAKTKIAQRKNKLVATSKQGYLPNNIIKSANKLGGYPHSALRRISVPVLAPDGAAGEGGFGVTLGPSDYSSAKFAVILPADYRAGTPLIVDVFYTRVGAGACTMSVGTAGVRFTPGNDTFVSLLDDPDFGPRSIDTSGRITTRLIPEVGVSLAKGDAAWVAFTRNGAESEDTCGATLQVVSAQVRY